MQYLANISQFENLQANQHARMGMSQMSVFNDTRAFNDQQAMPLNHPELAGRITRNASVEDIQASVQQYMQQIDTLRSVGADAEAQAEQAKLEKLLEDTNQGLQTATSTTMKTIADFKQSGRGEEPETPDVGGGMGGGAADAGGGFDMGGGGDAGGGMGDDLGGNYGKDEEELPALK